MDSKDKCLHNQSMNDWTLNNKSFAFNTPSISYTISNPNDCFCKRIIVLAKDPLIITLPNTCVCTKCPKLNKTIELSVNPMELSEFIDDNERGKHWFYDGTNNLKLYMYACSCSDTDGSFYVKSYCWSVTIYNEGTRGFIHSRSEIKDVLCFKPDTPKDKIAFEKLN